MANFADAHAQSAFAAEKMKKNNLFTTERMFCDVYCFEPGQEQTPHSHSGSDKVYFVIEGAARIHRSEEREVGLGAVALALSDVPMSLIRRAPKLLVFMAPAPTEARCEGAHHGVAVFSRPPS
jgi:quercetin dioxygenase-like cupin family protein